MAGSENSLKVRVDIPRNRLYCVVAGKITGKDIAEFFTDIRFGVADLKPGFDVVTDLTGCHLGHLAVIPTFRKIMHYIASKGVREVVRVVNKNSMVFRQAVNITAQFRSYKPVYVETMEEADQLLDQANARKGLRFSLLRAQVVFEAGEISAAGEVFDISISGCAIKTDAQLPEAGQKVLVKMTMTAPKSDDKTFALSGQVVRRIEQGFALTFDPIEDETKKQFLDCLVHELKRDV